MTLNQVILSPIVLATVFSWNFALTGQTSKIRNKIQTDMVPTMLNGKLDKHRLRFFALDDMRLRGRNLCLQGGSSGSLLLR